MISIEVASGCTSDRYSNIGVKNLKKYGSFTQPIKKVRRIALPMQEMKFCYPKLITFFFQNLRTERWLDSQENLNELLELHTKQCMGYIT